MKSLFKQRNGQDFEETILEARREGALETQEVSLILNVLRLNRRTVREIMVPRPDIICVEVDEDISRAAREIIEHGHSRLPVFQGDKDNIIGVIHAKDLLKSFLRPDGEQYRLSQLLRQPVFVSETMNVRDLLAEFQTRRSHLAIALDEYGGTSGIVTFEDALEEIVGEIEDEYDIQGPEDIQKLPGDAYLVSGRLPLEELNDSFQTGLESEQVETIGGYLCELSGRVPEEGDLFTFGGMRFTIKEADKKQIRWIQLEPALTNQAD